MDKKERPLRRRKPIQYVKDEDIEKTLLGMEETFEESDDDKDADPDYAENSIRRWESSFEVSDDDSNIDDPKPLVTSPIKNGGMISMNHDEMNRHSDPTADDGLISMDQGTMNRESDLPGDDSQMNDDWTTSMDHNMNEEHEFIFGNESANPSCESEGCNDEIFAACINNACLALLCFKHFDDVEECCKHNRSMNEKRCVALISVEKSILESGPTPENFEMDGSRREEPRPKRKRVNQQKQNKKSRDLGLGHKQTNRSHNLKPPKVLKPRCKGKECSRQGKECDKFTDDVRKTIHSEYWAMGNLGLQREYITRHARNKSKKRTFTANQVSRRNNTVEYVLPLNQSLLQVCKVMFLNTLAISEKTMRTSLKNLQESGVLYPEKRGGRSVQRAEKDMEDTEKIRSHINRFDRVESHYIRANSSREYLHSDLNLKKMYRMFEEENNGQPHIPSFSKYRNVFVSMNLTFHHPKKDLCSLCVSYREGNEESKQRLLAKYNAHIAEKEKVREIKTACKLLAKENEKIVSAIFDLQQVIYLPKSNDGQIFYKRRLANYNFTIYNLGSRDCNCYVWNEATSKRGSSEIATCLYSFLINCSEKGASEVRMFCDGCAGQNKNTIVAAMLLWAIKTLKIQEISIRYFETSHGQSEGDSVHSTIEYAIKNSGDLFMPSQLVSVIRLSRHQPQPYIVNHMDTKDFWDFKSLSTDLRILTIKKDNETGAPIKWTDMKEIAVEKKAPQIIKFKTSHLDTSFRSLTLKRLSAENVNSQRLEILNSQPPKISGEKFKDLMSLCDGNTPVIKHTEHVTFYRSLPHDN